MSATPLSTSVPPTSSVNWRPCYRLIPSRFPPIDLFERVADPVDWAAIVAVEELTNNRVRDQVGEISLVPVEHRVSGAGASYIMAPFTHVSSPGGRFSTPNFGAYYASYQLETAIRETVYHREYFLRATSEPPMELDMRELRANLRGDLHDIRGLRTSHPSLYDPSSYAASQLFATSMREGGSSGVVYDSVRDEGGQCVAVFIPRFLSDCKQADHYCYVWDGKRMDNIYKKSGLRAL